jgi:hypothetical protein
MSPHKVESVQHATLTYWYLEKEVKDLVPLNLRIANQQT